VVKIAHRCEGADPKKKKKKKKKKKGKKKWKKKIEIKVIRLDIGN
jgi:hypothetical protein